MELQTIEVTNYRSVENSGVFGAERLLCLVGKNEAGKTAVLQALCGLNPHPATPVTFDKERDYPRRYLTEYETRHRGEDAVVITTTWTLNDQEADLITSEFGNASLDSKDVIISRGYGDKSPKWRVDINFKAAVDHLIENARFNAAERAQVGEPDNTQTLRAALNGIANRTEKQNQLLALIDGFPGTTITGRVNHLLAKSLPKFMYFSHYDRMAGQIRIDDFDTRTTNGSIEISEQVFVDFLEYAGTSIAEIKGASTYEALNARCEAASNRITEQLLEYWTQNPNLEIDVRVTKAEPNDPPPFNSGIVARARVRNNLHKVSVPFSERSAGFIWFFSFLVKFAQVQKDHGELVLVLDEPGLTLHGKAQADLLRYFREKLEPNHQVVFSTHSPFMVPADRFDTVRLVEDRITMAQPGRWVSEGTKVREDALATDRDTLFPLQGALGYEITQTLFVGKHTLLVEGPGDVLYLQAWSTAISNNGGKGLDRRWTICPAGGIDKIQPFVSLFAGARLDIAALTDYAAGDKRKLEALSRNRVLEDGRLITFAGVLALDEADIEDVFDTELYLEIVNAAYELPKELALTTEHLHSNGGDTSRLVKRVENCFKLMPSTVPEFDHFTPAAWLIRNPAIFDSKKASVAATIDRAAKVIESVNKILG